MIVNPDGTISSESIGYTTSFADLIYWKEGNSFLQKPGTVMRISPNGEILDNNASDPSTVLIAAPKDLNTLTDQIVAPGMEYLFFDNEGVRHLYVNTTESYLVIRTDRYQWNNAPIDGKNHKYVSKIVPITK